MAWLFNFLYLAILAVTWPWLLIAALRRKKYRDGWSQKLLGLVPPRNSQRPCVWLHAVSVGEVNLLQVLLTRIESEHPQWDVVISTTTAAGYAVAKKRYAPRTVFYAPLDFSWAVRQALARIRPEVLILAELEVWPNLVRAAYRRGVKIAVINGRLSDRSFRGYQKLSWLFHSTFARLDVAAQSHEYAARFQKLGAPQATSTGSLKFDNAQGDRASAATRRLAETAGIEPEDIIFLAGSTQAPEESLAIATFQALADRFPKLKLVLVPRHPERFEEVAQLLDRHSVHWERRSMLRRSGFQPATSEADTTAGWKPAQRARILLVDAVGELKDWWGVAQIGFVGGSLGNRGGQNMIEPAAYGVATCFGPNTWNFRDVVSLFLAHEAVEVVSDGQQLSDFVERCLTDAPYASNLGQRAADLVRQQQGAAEKTMQLLRPLFENERGRARRVDDPQSPRPSVSSLTTSTYSPARHSPPIRLGTRRGRG